MIFCNYHIAPTIITHAMFLYIHLSHPTIIDISTRCINDLLYNVSLRKFYSEVNIDIINVVREQLHL